MSSQLTRSPKCFVMLFQPEHQISPKQFEYIATFNPKALLVPCIASFRKMHQISSNDQDMPQFNPRPELCPTVSPSFNQMHQHSPKQFMNIAPFVQTTLIPFPMVQPLHSKLSVDLTHTDGVYLVV